MRKYALKRGAYFTKGEVGDYFKGNKVFLIFLLVIAGVSLITGVFTAIKSSNTITSYNIYDNLLVSFLKGDSSFLGYFFSRFFVTCLIILLMYLLSFSIFLMPLPILFLVYKAYILGVNSVVLILLFGISGIFNVVFVVLPCHLLILVCYVVAACLAMKRALVIKKYGRFCSPINSKKWFLFLIPIFSICLLETVLINLTYKTFIFVI